MAKYCSNCGAELKGKFCENCGTSVGETENLEKITEPTTLNINQNIKPKKKKSNGCLVPFFILVLIGIVGFTLTTLSDSKGQSKKTKIIINADEFSGISAKQLKEKMGKPDKKDKWEFDTGVGKYDTTTYSYDNGKYEFLIIKDKVVRLNIALEKKHTISSDKAIMDLFGVVEGDDIIKISDTGSALRYQLVNDKIDDIWIPIIKEDKFDAIKITYNQMLFGTLELPFLEQSKLQAQLQEVVKNILKSPSTAKFASITDWSMWKEKKGICIQGYVDSQNSFGAELRNEFQFILDDDYTIKSFIFDGKELM